MSWIYCLAPFNSSASARRASRQTLPSLFTLAGLLLRSFAAEFVHEYIECNNEYHELDFNSINFFVHYVTSEAAN